MTVYGYNDHEDGTTVLWEHGDEPLDPFNHIAEIKDWEAFTRWLAWIRETAIEACRKSVPNPGVMK